MIYGYLCINFCLKTSLRSNEGIKPINPLFCYAKFRLIMSLSFVFYHKCKHTSIFRLDSVSVSETMLDFDISLINNKLFLTNVLFIDTTTTRTS